MVRFLKITAKIRLRYHKHHIQTKHTHFSISEVLTKHSVLIVRVLIIFFLSLSLQLHTHRLTTIYTARRFTFASTLDDLKV